MGLAEAIDASLGQRSRLFLRSKANPYPCFVKSEVGLMATRADQ